MLYRKSFFLSLLSVLLSVVIIASKLKLVNRFGVSGRSTGVSGEIK